MKIHPLLVVVILGSFFSLIGVRQYYTRTKPETPQPELQRTIPMEVNYGKTVYISAAENRNFNMVYTIAPLNIAAVMAYLFWRARKSGRDRS